MDFNTGGGSGRPDDRPLYGDETGGPARSPERGPVGGSGGEFNLQDPVNSFVGTVRALVLDPVGFFRGIPKRGNFVNPIAFALICAVINGILGGVIGFLISLVFLGDPDVGVVGAFGNLILSIILAPIIAVIALFIVAGIFHLLVLLLVRPSNAGFEATTRAVSYSFVYYLISWIPLIGWLIGPIYGIVLSIFGIREAHATTTGRAVAVVLITVAILVLILLLLVSILVALGLGAALFLESQPQIQ